MSDEFNDLGGGDFNESEPPAPPRNNRPLLIGAGVLAGIFLIGLIALVVYAMVIAPQMRSRQAAQVAQALAQQTASAQVVLQQTAAANSTAIAKAPTLAPTATATLRPTMTRTPVAVFSTATPSTSLVAGTAQTSTAAAQKTQTALRPTPTALPATGLADEVGFPGLLGLAVGLILVILIARRLRS